MALTLPPAAAQPDVIIVNADSQDYSKQTGRMTAEGNVKVSYQDTTGQGPGDDDAEKRGRQS